MKAVIDTNILIDYLNGYQLAADEIERYTSPLISRITWIEVLVGAGDKDEPSIRTFLRQFQIQEIDRSVGEEAVKLRRQHRLRLPDAIVFASARVQECLLVTRNTRDFDPSWPDVREPYRL